MDKITHEIRLSNWKGVIEQCQSRPKGQTITSWCKENGISLTRIKRKRFYNHPSLCYS